MKEINSVARKAILLVEDNKIEVPQPWPVSLKAQKPGGRILGHNVDLLLRDPDFFH